MGNSLDAQTNTEFFKIKEKKLEAIAEQDPEKFYKICTEAGLSGEEDSMLYELGEYISIRKTKYKNETSHKIPKLLRETKFDYKSFGKEVERTRLNPYNMENPREKAMLLKKYGINRLTISKGYHVPIEQAKKSRITSVFKERFQAYERRNQ